MPCWLNPSTGSWDQIDPRPYELFNIKNGLNVYRQDFMTLVYGTLVYVFANRGHSY